MSEALVCSLPNLQAHYQIDDEVTSASSDAHKTKMDAALQIPSPTLRNVESSAENDLGRLVANEARSLGETQLPREDSLPVDIATSSRICLYREKGKEKAKASSDGDIYGRSSNDKDDDSHETVESCNSARLGVKRQHYDREQEIGSKRTKKCLQESPGSTPVIKGDSSFMKWISNMVKGLTDSNKEEPSVLALTLAHSNNVCSYNHQESFICNKTNEFAKPKTGFQNVFQSLYCQTNKTPISGVKKDSQLVEESDELMVADKMPLDITPKSCNSNNDSSCKQIALSDQEANPHTSTRPIKPWIFSADFLNRYSSEKSLPENKALDTPENPTGSSCKKADITAEKMDLDTPLPVNCVPEKSRPLPSLWITRLYTNTAQFDNRNSERLEANHESWANDVSSNGKKTTKGKDDCSRDQTRASESVDLRFSDKQIPIQPFHESRSSEAMASVFAKRLDALRHILHPSERRCSPTFPVTCFYCGDTGHDLRKCAELTETELENLLLNISSFNRVDKSPCLCIRCFQLDHWAISCPSAPSQENRRSKQNAGAVKRQSTSHLQPSADDHKNKFAVEVDCSRKPASGSFPNFLTWNMKGLSSKRLSTSNEFQKSTLSNAGNHLKEKQVFQPCIAVPHEDMFHVIRRLRLSRSDILRY